MALIDYNTFVANVQEGHLNLLSAFTAGTRVRVLNTDTVAIDTMRQQCEDLFGNELLTRVAEGYERVGSDVWRTFDGYVNEAAKGYVDRLARERIALSREPVPA